MLYRSKARCVCLCAFVRLLHKPLYLIYLVKLIKFAHNVYGCENISVTIFVLFLKKEHGSHNQLANLQI